MKPESALKYKLLFEKTKLGLVYSSSIINTDFHVHQEDLADEADLTTSELETSMRMRLRNREALFIKKINEALQRIAEGTFGDCASCENEIEMKRLDARPTTTLCLECKEDQERQERLHIDGHKPKSLGQKIRFA